jgi:hypothetical protein
MSGHAAAKALEYRAKPRAVKKKAELSLGQVQQGGMKTAGETHHVLHHPM